MSKPASFANTLSDQWAERTLDDSAIRRIDIPGVCPFFLVPPFMFSRDLTVAMVRNVFARRCHPPWSRQHHGRIGRLPEAHLQSSPGRAPLHDHRERMWFIKPPCLVDLAFPASASPSLDWFKRPSHGYFQGLRTNAAPYMQIIMKLVAQGASRQESVLT